MINQLHNEDCHVTMGKMVMEGVSPNIILTSPPYNTERVGTGSTNRELYEHRYDVYEGGTDQHYIQWTLDLFNRFDKVLAPNGAILYNMSYGTDSSQKGRSPNQLLWRVLNAIIEHTPFTTADTIIWKKKSALPNNMSPNKLTRITEFVFVLCRESEYKTFLPNKNIVSFRGSGQPNYENVFNFIEAPNNDGITKLNKATFSSELVEKLLGIYAPRDTSDFLVYDPFMGTGTTAVGCKHLGIPYIGSELSKDQNDYAVQRVAETSCLIL